MPEATLDANVLVRRLNNNGRFLIPFAAFFYAVMSASVKAIGTSVPIYETIFFRAGISALILGIMMKKRRIGFRPKNFSLLTTRSLSGLLAMTCNFYVLNHLSLGDTAILINTFPIFVALLSFLFLGERPSRTLLLYIGIAMLGIVLILRPQFNFLNYAGFIALLAAILSAIVVIAIHQSHETDPSLRIAFYFTANCALITAPILFQHFVIPGIQEGLLLGTAGICGTVGQAFMTKAYGIEDVSRLSPLAYTGVIFSFMMDILFWGTMPSLWSLVGSGIVIASCIQIARLERPEPMMN